MGGFWPFGQIDGTTPTRLWGICILDGWRGRRNHPVIPANRYSFSPSFYHNSPTPKMPNSTAWNVAMFTALVAAITVLAILLVEVKDAQGVRT